uniref:Uncharacterized protein n=1 Tax=Lotus japonicus TaxID=34305 RepID=I3S250_LOTJA|nr:unknown [Lotus japonicus]
MVQLRNCFQKKTNQSTRMLPSKISWHIIMQRASMGTLPWSPSGCELNMGMHS